MTRPDFDVVVAGAGAGGSAAAYYLSQAGLDVLVVDKARLPRYKACGGAIPQAALDRLPFSLDGVIRAAPTEVTFTYPGQPSVDVPLPERPVAMVMRSEFDALLLNRSGAEVWDGAAVIGVVERDEGVQVEVKGRKLSARYLIGADGAASTIARHLGLRSNRRLGGTIEAEVPLDGKRDLRERYGSRAVFSFGLLTWGYSWVFPKGDLLSVGIGRFRPGRVDLNGVLQSEMSRLGIALNGAPVHGHPIPSYQAPPWPLWRRQPQERLSTRRCLLVGDAAGLVDPLMGEGIRYAIESGRLAALAIAGADLSGYEEAIWLEMGHSLATAGLTASIFYRWPKRCYQLGVRNPATVGEFVALMQGGSSYLGIGRRLIRSTLNWTLAKRNTP